MFRNSTLTMRPRVSFLAAAALLTGALMNIAMAGDTRPSSIYDFTMKNIDGTDVPLSSYKGKVLLVVNVASQCGNTPQYKDLEAMYEKYKDKGLVILGFPANNFGAQEPGTNAEIKEFCSTTYGVTFPMFSKISVKGADQHPLYGLLTGDKTFGGEVKWNFQKYLVDRSGRLIGKFIPKANPSSKEVTDAVEVALAAGE